MNDKLMIWNPGELPESWSVDTLKKKHTSRPFNPVIANAFFRAGEIEAWGRGINKINGECRKHGIPMPDYDFEMSGLMITFHANPAHIEAAGSQTAAGATKTSVKTPVETPVKILQLLQKHPEMTLTEVAKIIGKSASAVERASSKLVKEGRLKYVGPQKGGHWEVIRKDGDK